MFHYTINSLDTLYNLSILFPLLSLLGNTLLHRVISLQSCMYMKSSANDRQYTSLRAK